MIDLVRINSTKFGLDKPIIFECSRQDEWVAARFVLALERWMKDENRSLSEGQTVSCGFWIIKLIQRDGAFWFDERCPDHDVFRSGAEFAFRAMRHQQTICEMHDALFEPISAGENAAVNKMILEGGEIRGWHHQPSRGFTGWYFTAQHEATFRNCHQMPISELIKVRPDLIKFLGLPVGAGVLSSFVQIDLNL